MPVLREDQDNRTGRGGWRWIVGCGCCSCAVLAVVVLIALGWAVSFLKETMVGQIEKMQSSTPLPAAQRRYVGIWKGADGTKIVIRADGTGGFEAGDTSVDGDDVVIDGVKRTIEIGGLLPGTEKRWEIDQPPRRERGKTVMVLSGVKFHRTGAAAP